MPAIIINGPAGRMEARYTHSKIPNAPLALILHPAPDRGGSMNHRIPYSIYQAMVARGFSTLRFNFRGVGKSSGEFGHGVGELDDLRAVVEWVQQNYAPKELWLAGFSFGSYVALRGHEMLGATRLILIAPPMERFDFSQLYLSKTPTIVVQGAKDDVVSPDAVYQWVSSQMNAPNFIWMPDADHFFHGKLTELREELKKSWATLS